MRYVFGRVRVRPERRANFVEVTEPFVTATRLEPDCLHFEVAESLADRNLFIVVECFASAAAHAAHLATAHYRTLLPHFEADVLEADFDDIDSDAVKYTHVGAETH